VLGCGGAPGTSQPLGGTVSAGGDVSDAVEAGDSVTRGVDGIGSVDLDGSTAFDTHDGGDAGVQTTSDATAAQDGMQASEDDASPVTETTPLDATEIPDAATSTDTAAADVQNEVTEINDDVADVNAVDAQVIDDASGDDAGNDAPVPVDVPSGDDDATGDDPIDSGDAPVQDAVADTPTPEDVAVVEDLAPPADMSDGLTAQDDASAIGDVPDVPDMPALTCVDDPQLCDDGDACTLDACALSTVSCTHSALPPSACDDGQVCTEDSCDPAAGCLHAPKPFCCAPDLVLMDIGFEQNSLEGFTASAGPTDENVSWHVDTHRAFTGAASAYLGNACHTYDTAAVTWKDCAPQSGSSGPIAAILMSPEVALVADRASVLDFGLWIGAEPKLGSGQTPVTCTPTCADGYTCVDANGTKLCLPEKDVLRVRVVSGGVETEVWNSLSVGKSTTGWLHVAVDLGAYLGSAIKIEWAFSTTDGSANHYEGVYVDAVRIRTVCEFQPPCAPGAGCVTDGKACTSDTCTPYVNGDDGKGRCFYDSLGCCEGDDECDDGNECTVDACVLDDPQSGTKACQHAPNGSNEQCCQTSALWSAGFEGSLAGWETSGESSTNARWRIGDLGADGAHSLWFGNSVTKTYADSKLGALSAVKGTICAAALDLPLGVPNIEASFQLRLSTEFDGLATGAYKNPDIKGTVKRDWLRAWLKLPGETHDLWSSDLIAGTTGGAWTKVTLDLSPYKGTPAQLCFTFDTGNGSNNANEGPFIDAVNVSLVCHATTCGPTLPACAATCGSCAWSGCTASSECACASQDECCLDDAMCDDGNPCSVDTCATGAQTCGYTSITDTPACCVDTTIALTGFEDPLLPAGWAASTMPGTPSGGGIYAQKLLWSAGNDKALDGAWSLRFGNGASYESGTEVPAGQVITEAWQLPVTGWVNLEFDLFLDTEWTGAAFKDPGFVLDELSVSVVEFPGPQTPVKVWSSYALGGSTNGKWLHVAVDLAAWKGKAIALAIGFDAGNTVNNAHGGVHIDSLRVARQCAEPACAANAQCKDTDACTWDACIGGACAHGDVINVPGCCMQGTVFGPAGFEGGALDSDWTVKGNSTSVKWQVMESPILGGTYAAYFGVPSAHNYNDPLLGGTGPSGTLATPTLAVTSDAKKKPVLTFKLYLDIETSFETFQLRALDPLTGTVIDTIWSNASLDAGVYKTPIEVSVDLTKLKGQTVVLAFFFDAVDDYDNTTFEGIYLDDITLTELCL